MKPWLCSLTVVAVLLAGGPRSGFTDDVSKLQSEFEKLRADSDRALQEKRIKIRYFGNAQGGVAKGAPGKSPVVMARSKALRKGPQLAIKVWGRLAVPPSRVGAKWKADRHVNLANHRWRPGDSYFLCIDTAVPIQLGLFQIFPDRIAQIAPDPRHEVTYRTILPGQVWQSPRLILDEDPKDEDVSIVVVRADAPILPINGAALPAVQMVLLHNRTNVTVDGAPGATAVAESSTNVVDNHGKLDPYVMEATREVLGGINKLVYRATKGGPSRVAGSVKMSFANPPRAVSNRTDDKVANEVATIVLGNGPIGQMQVRFQKSR